MTSAPVADPRERLVALGARLAQAPGDAAAAYEAADIASDHGWEEAARPLVAAAAERNPRDARLWHMLGVVHRGLEDSAEAMAAFGHAIAEDPRFALAAHGLARATMEAGLPAVDRFAAARRLAPHDLDVLLGQAAALAAVGGAEAAQALLAGQLAATPDWIDGHHSFAKLSAARGEAERATATIDAALRHRPGDVALHVARATVLARTATPAARLGAIEAARRIAGDQRELVMQHAVAASEAGAIDEADRLFLAVGRHADHGFALAQLRHLVRAARWEQAEMLASRLVAGPQAMTAWAYRHTAWRMMDDPRLRWLDQEGALVRTYDISASLPPLDRLAETLRAIHRDRAQPIDQSVRHGTQTDGPLFARIDPVIRATREAIRAAVAAHIRGLPPLGPDHPAWAEAPEARPRFTGAWSVRLTGGGHHVSHIHPAGWLSSALYIALPDGMGAGEDGLLTLGTPPAELGISLAPLRTIRPQAGHLALFPSHAWHGVTPSLPGERLTIAFDVARPRPGISLPAAP